MLKTEDLTLNTKLYGASGNFIDNPAAGIWDFHGTTLDNATVITTGGFSDIGKTLFVEPNFSDTGVFRNSITSAIDYIVSEAKTNGTIIIFPGTYTEQLVFNNITNLTLIGLGEVIINLTGGNLTLDPAIDIDGCDNLNIKNLKIRDGNNELIGFTAGDIITVNNSNCIFDSFDIHLSTTTYENINFLNIVSPSGLNKIINSKFYLEFSSTNPLTLDNNINILYYDGTGTDGFIEIDNSKFKVDFSQNDNSFETIVSMANFYSDTTNTYRFIIKNSEFEFNPVVIIDLNVLDLIKCIGAFTNDNYNKVLFINSLTNSDYNASINDQNIYENADFKVLF